MTLTEEIQKCKTQSAWTIVFNKVQSHIKDPLLVESLMNMLTMKYRFDHFQYVSLIPTDYNLELIFLKQPFIAEALILVEKLKFALPHFPHVYQHIWIDVYKIVLKWEHDLLYHPEKNYLLALEIIARTP